MLIVNLRSLKHLDQPTILKKYIYFDEDFFIIILIILKILFKTTKYIGISWNLNEIRNQNKVWSQHIDNSFWKWRMLFIQKFYYDHVKSLCLKLIQKINCMNKNLRFIFTNSCCIIASLLWLTL